MRSMPRDNYWYWVTISRVVDWSIGHSRLGYRVYRRTVMRAKIRCVVTLDVILPSTVI